MQMKRKDYANGYNAQILTENQFILVSHVSSSPADYSELVPTIEKLISTDCEMPKKLLADTGYFSEENLSFLEGKEIDAYVPPQRKDAEDPLHDMRYSEEKDEYSDDRGNVFVFHQNKDRKGTPKARM